MKRRFTVLWLLIILGYALKPSRSIASVLACSLIIKEFANGTRDISSASSRKQATEALETILGSDLDLAMRMLQEKLGPDAMVFYEINFNGVKVSTIAHELVGNMISRGTVKQTLDALVSGSGRAGPANIPRLPRVSAESLIARLQQDPATKLTGVERKTLREALMKQIPLLDAERSVLLEKKIGEAEGRGIMQKVGFGRSTETFCAEIINRFATLNKLADIVKLL